MNDVIVHSLSPITLVGGADYAAGQLDRARAQAPRVVAADGGAVSLLAQGVQPEVVIGDMDSLPLDVAEALGPDRLHRVREQDSTDFEKCLQRIDAPLVLGLGFLGGALGHQLAALHALMRFAHKRCILIGGGELVFLCPPELTLEVPQGTPLSVFPLGPALGSASGLKWPFEDLAFAPGVRIGTSNSVTGALHMQMSAPAALCILPETVLKQVITQLVAQPGWSPVRA